MDVESWPIWHFAQSNPDGPGQGDPAALLRRCADSIDALGDVQVHDIVFQVTPTADEDDLLMTVYFTKEPRPK